MQNNGMPQNAPPKRGLRKGVVMALLAALITLACTCSTQNLPSSIRDLIGSSAEPSASAPQSSGTVVLLQDDFSDPNSGWEAAQYEAGEVGYADGAYFVTSIVENKAMWGLAFKDFADVSIEVTATQVRGPDNNNNDYGVMCRMTETSGYGFNISGDGFYSIQRMDDNAFTDLVEWTESSAINVGNATNTIRVICQGSTLSLYVNGSKLAETSDSTYTSGDIALATTTYETETSEIHFDNITVTEP